MVCLTVNSGLGLGVFDKGMVLKLDNGWEHIKSHVESRTWWEL